MEHNVRFIKIVFLIIALFFLYSCDLFKNDNPVGPTTDGKITYENEKILINTISPAGSTIVVNSDNSTINGMKIVIPKDCFTGSRKFNISTFDIKEHKFSEYLKPISPLIKIASNGGYADGIYEVTIPVVIEKGYFPLVFIYDENNQKLEPLPVENYDEKSVTFTTRHFSTSTLFPKATKGNTPIIQSDEGYSLIFVSSMQESIINQTSIISTGFKPGVDDWEFPNYGSYIEPKGHCAGQNLGAFWYFYEKRLKGAPGLNNLMSTVDRIWEDNNRGYRFCSTIQSDIPWEGKFLDFFRKFIDKDQSKDKLKYYLIAGAMLITGEPQAIGIYRVTGQDQSGKDLYAGHALICYQIEPVSGKLYISDPNYPSVEQSIYFKDGKFEPYQASLNARLSKYSYPFVTYRAKTAYIEWNKIGERWKEVEDYKIGNDTFPKYFLVTPDFGGKNLSDEFNYNIDTLNIRVEVPTLDAAYYVDNTKYAGITLYDENGVRLTNRTYNIRLKFDKPGTIKYGLLIEGFRSDEKTNNNEYEPLYIDFKWITINYSKYNIKIIPKELKGEPNVEYTWNVDISELPKDFKYYVIWSFGDKNEVRKNNENFVTYKYSLPGNYKIKAELYELTTNKLVAVDSAIAEIASKDRIYPNFGPRGQTVKITGKGFKDSKYSEISATLHWDQDPTNHNYRALKTKVIDDNTLEAIIIDDTKNTIGKVYLKVRKYISTEIRYEWEGPWEYEIVKLQVNQLTPDTIRTGALVTIKGKNFGIYHPTDNVLMSLTPATSIKSWTNEEIVFEAPELSSSGNHYIYIAKSCNTYENNLYCTNHQVGEKYWEPLPSDVIKLLSTATKEGEGFVIGNFDITVSTYDSKGNVTGKYDTKYQVFESLFNKATTNSFKVNGRTFEATINRGSYGKLIYTGTVSSDGKTLETATITRYNEMDKIILKLVLQNIPLNTIYKAEPRALWKYAAKNNATSHIKEFYYANYTNDGKLQSDGVMKNCTDISFDLDFYYK